MGPDEGSNIQGDGSRALAPNAQMLSIELVVRRSRHFSLCIWHGWSGGRRGGTWHMSRGSWHAWDKRLKLYDMCESASMLPRSCNRRSPDSKYSQDLAIGFHFCHPYLMGRMCQNLLAELIVVEDEHRQVLGAVTLVHLH